MISKRRERLLALACVAIVVARAVWGAATDASVADEHPHLLSGWLYWQTGWFAGGFDNPPLGQLWLTGPWVLSRVPYVFGNDAGLWLARLPALGLLVALALVVWRIGRAALGPAVGLAAIAALAFEPNSIAHGRLATLDGPLTAVWWAALWAWRRSLVVDAATASVVSTPARLHQPAVVAFALLAAAATLVKFTGVLLYPIAAALVFAAPAAVRRKAWVAIACSLPVALVLTFAVYGFDGVESGLPRALVEGLRGKWEHRQEVKIAYLAGERGDQGFIEYFLVALGLKTPLPLLVLAAWGLARGGWSRLDRAFLVVPAFAIVITFSFIRVDLGIRQVLPAMPALVLAAAAGAVDLARRRGPWRIAAAACVVAWVAGVLRNAPQDIAYFNVLAGGGRGGHRFLLDSNLAWGQDDRRLARALARARSRNETWEVLPDPWSPRDGRVAIECNALHNSNRASDRPYEWVRALQPVSFAGWSWRFYDIDRADYAEAARRRPRDVAAQCAWAAMLEAEGEAARADSVWRVAAVIDPAGVASRVARRAIEAGDPERALAWLRTAPRDPETILWTERAVLERAVRVADGSGAARAHWDLGLWLAEHAAIDAALPHLEAAAQSPSLAGDGEVQRAFAVGLSRVGRWEEAAAHLERRQLHRVFVAEWEACRDLAAANQVVARATADGIATAGECAGAADGEVRFELGRAHFEAGRFDPAARAFATLLADDPRHRLALAYWGEMQVRCKFRIATASLPALRLEPHRRRQPRLARRKRRTR